MNPNDAAVAHYFLALEQSVQRGGLSTKEALQRAFNMGRQMGHADGLEHARKIIAGTSAK